MIGRELLSDLASRLLHHLLPSSSLQQDRLSGYGSRGHWVLQRPLKRVQVLELKRNTFWTLNMYSESNTKLNRGVNTNSP